MSIPTFHYYATPFENSKVPCLVRDDIAGGDPHIICTFGRIYNPDALYELCSLANSVIDPGGLLRAEEIKTAIAKHEQRTP